MKYKRIVAVVPVYRDAIRAKATVDALLRCTVPAPFLLRVQVVDDGSQDGTGERLTFQFSGRVDVLQLTRNMGRSFARNAGAAKADADLLLFVDADCEPIDANFIIHHLEAIQASDVSMGTILGQNDGFWHSYQEASAARRIRLARRTPIARFTTQNVMIDARLFARIGGFDETFKGYGFEDRDLAIRLAKEGGRFATAGEACVIHRDNLALDRVCAKMLEAGATTSTIFAERHPFEYRALGYEAIDARRHPWRGLVARVAWPLLRLLARHDAWLHWSGLPFAARASAVRLMSALSYLYGTLQR
jgi:GT2 family glycosyltransferase